MNKKILLLILFLAIVGMVDSGYLTFEHYSSYVPPCKTGFTLIDCGVVLRSKFSTILGIPVALFGVGYYLFVFIQALLAIFRKRKVWRLTLFLTSCMGLIVSFWLTFLQVFVIKFLCAYCLVSAADSVAIFVLALLINEFNFHR